ncbi:hypothetical protein [Wolbachia endosymbiont of Cantharis cryptica]|uniref:hypothetical protein n=1 Tax=Wolbachia endosymbiont of Cantharis cryptica TaxID=3066132 RepID=UPI00376EBC04
MFGVVNDLVKERKTSGQLEDSGVKSVVLKVAQDTSSAISYLSMLCGRMSEPSQDNDCINFIKGLKKSIIDCRSLPSLISLEDDINRIGEENPTAKNLTIMRFLHSIAKNDQLYKKLKILNDLAKNCDGTPSSTNYGRFHFRLREVVTDFKLLNLGDKVKFLEFLKEKRDFKVICETYGNWYADALINDKDFRKHIDEALDEEDGPFGENFRRDLHKYTELAQLGKKAVSESFQGVVSKYFNKKNEEVVEVERVGFQAYYTETKKVLNINFTYCNKEIAISDILQYDKNTRNLNIYYNKKPEVSVCKYEGKKRYYEFKEGACCQMTSEWPIDESGRVVSICTMVMNLDSNGITKIVKFNGKEFNGEDYTLLSKEDKKLIKRNEALFIEGFPLCEAVEEFLKKQRGLRCGKEVKCGEGIIQIGKGEEHNPALSSDAVPTSNRGNTDSNPTTDSGASIPTEVNLRDSETQTGTTSKQITGLESKNQRLKKENTEYKQFIEAGLQEMNKRFSAQEKEIQVLSSELRNISVEKEKSDQSFAEAKQETKELKARNDNLQDKLKRGKQKIDKREAMHVMLVEIAKSALDTLCLDEIVRHYDQKGISGLAKKAEQELMNSQSENDESEEFERELELSHATLRCVRGLKGIIQCLNSSNDDGYSSSDEEPGNTCSNPPVSTPTRNRMSLCTTVR